MAQQHAAGAERARLVGARIREVRKALHLTQTDLSARIGVQQSDLSRMEKGEYRVGLDTLFRVLAVFQMDLGTFFGDATALPAGDPDAWEEFRALSEAARQEVREFIRFKFQQENPASPGEGVLHSAPVGESS